MEFQIGDIVKLKKAHPCGINEWEILRVGMDFRLKCVGCGRQVMVPRKMVEKNFRGFIKKVAKIRSLMIEVNYSWYIKISLLFHEERATRPKGGASNDEI